jgi:hypothetical protein
VAQEQEVALEDVVDMPVREPRKRRRDQWQNLAAVCHQKEQNQNLDARRRRKEQKRALRKNGCRRNLVAARRGTTRRVQVAQRNFSPTKDTTREYCESWKDLAATGREEARHAEVVRYKGNFVRRNRRKEIATGRNHTKDKIKRGTRRLRALMKGFWTCQAGRTGPEDLSGESYVASRNIKCWNLWRGRPPPKRIKYWSKKSRVWGSTGHSRS